MIIIPFFINPVQTKVPFLYPWRFLMFSGAIEIEHWANMG